MGGFFYTQVFFEALTNALPRKFFEARRFEIKLVRCFN